MTINKFTGKTKEEAIECAKQAFGPNAVIMNIKEIKPKGLFGIFKSSTYEVTAAMDCLLYTSYRYQPSYRRGC